MIIEDEINEINKEILFINSLLADINNVGFLSKDELLAIKRKQAVFNHKLIDLKLEKAKKEAAHQAIIIEKKEKLNIKKILHMKSEKYIFLLKKEMIKIIQRKYLIEENEIEEVLYAKSKLNKNS
nr:type III secretion apparatus protein SpaM [Arsenophonus nasoniae]